MEKKKPEGVFVGYRLTYKTRHECMYGPLGFDAAVRTFKEFEKDGCEPVLQELYAHAPMTPQ